MGYTPKVNLDLAEMPTIFLPVNQGEAGIL